MMNYRELPHFGRVQFKDSGALLLTTTMAHWGPLTSTYSGFEVAASEIKNTAIFICQFTQKRLTSRIVDQGDFVHVSANESYLITGLKDFGSHTEIVGLKQSAVVTPSAPSGIVSEWAFRDEPGLGDDEQGRNFLTNVNTVSFSSDKPSQVSSAFGSGLFVSGNSERLEITDASQISLDITGSITIAFRVKLTSTPTGTMTFVAKSGGSGGGQVAYSVHTDTSNKLKFALSNDGTNETVAVGATSLSTGVWYSVACVYDGTDMRIYLDGVLDSNGSNNPKTYSSGIFDSNEKFVLGARSDASQFLDGRLAHVFVFNVDQDSTAVGSWHTNDSWS